MLEEIDVSQYQIRFGDNPDFESAMPGEFLEDRAGYFEALFCWLIRIGRGPNRDFFSRFDVTKLLPQQVRGMLLDEDLLLEVDAVAHFHEFVGIARVAVFAGELASAVGIDCPGKGHADAGASVEQRTNG